MSAVLPGLTSSQQRQFPTLNDATWVVITGTLGALAMAPLMLMASSSLMQGDQGLAWVRWRLTGFLLQVPAFLLMAQRIAARHEGGLTGWMRMQRIEAKYALGGVVYFGLYLAVLALPLVAAVALGVFGSPEQLESVEGWALQKLKISHAVLLIVGGTLAIPLIEESLFRALIYRALRQRNGVAAAAVLSSALYAALHFSLTTAVFLFILGIFCALAYERTGSLLAPITIHSLHNLLSIVVSPATPPV